MQRFAQTRLVLLDRDGTINVERHYLSSPDEVELLPNAADGIKLLQSIGFKLVVITNQSAIGRGYFDLMTLDHIHNRLQELLSEQGASLDGVYFCPHRPDENCACRKPLPALAERAAEDFNSDLTNSFLIGDNVCDIELGRRIGATTILVRTGYGAELEKQAEVKPDYVVANLLEAAKLIQQLYNEV